MTQQTMNGAQFAQMIQLGAENLSRHSKEVDALNVFPVPDGDTGTNMNLSFSSGVEEMKQANTKHIGEVAKSLSKGLLMGARGNSGVILSQLFRGLAKAIEDKEEMNAYQFAVAMQQGVDTAYKAVMKPVEGTILTVAKDSAKEAKTKAKQTDNLIEVMQAVLAEAKASLQRTPDLLSVLKEVGVVDSGGQGLVYVYEGFLSALQGVDLPERDQQGNQQDENYFVGEENKEEHVHNEVAAMMAEGVLSVDDITYGYCTEFIIRLHPHNQSSFQETAFRKKLSEYGDSLLVIADDELVKIHIHAEELNQVMGLAQSYGELTNIKIENMREQFLAVKDSGQKQGSVAQQGENKETQEGNEQSDTEPAPFGIVTVAVGKGIENIFRSLGADVVIAGGQTMNPSTEEFVKAIRDLHVDNVIILPNNSNIILAAEQAAALTDLPTAVIPTKNVPQGMAALLSFQPEAALADNEEMMKETMNEVKAGQVTHAVRDTELDGVEIKEGEYMGLFDGKIATTGQDMTQTTVELARQLIDEMSEIVTIIYGEDVSKEEAEALSPKIEEMQEEIEVEIHHGGQPLYPYFISVE